MLGLLIAFPLAGAVFLLAFGRRIGEPVAGWIGSATVAASFLLALPMAFGFIGGTDHGEVIHLFSWIPSLGVDVELLWDPLSALMTLGGGWRRPAVSCSELLRSSSPSWVRHSRCNHATPAR